MAEQQLIEQMVAEVAEAPAEAPVEAAPVQEELPVQAEGEQAPAEDAPFTEDDREALNKALRAERKRARDLEKAVKEYQEKVDKVAQEDMNEQQKAVAEAVAAARAEAKAEFDAQILKLRVEAKAGQMNFHDPALALSLLDVEADATDDELEDALKALAGDRPYLVKAAAPKADLGPRGTDNGAVMPTSNEDWFRNLMMKQ